MKTVTIEVSKLLKHLKANRTQHIKDFEEAMVGYREAVVKAVSAQLKKAKNNEDIEHSIKVVRPVSFLDSYDEAISMLEWNTQKEVELDRMEFKQYVQDEWAWKQAFAATSAMYKG